MGANMQAAAASTPAAVASMPVAATCTGAIAVTGAVAAAAATTPSDWVPLSSPASPFRIAEIRFRISSMH